MARTTPRNLRRGVGRISGGIVDKLNALGRASGLEGHENIGSELAREINQHLAKISVRQDAQAGFGGPVAIAKQTRQSASGPPSPGLMLSGNRIGETAPALAGTDVPNYDQVKTLFTCDGFGGHPSGFAGWFEDCVDQRKKAETAAAVTGIMPYFFGWTVHAPNATDSIFTDGNTGGQCELWSFVLPDPAEVQALSFFIGYQPVIPGHGPVTINYGLFDADYNLVFQSGTQTFTPGTTAYTFRPHRVKLDQVYELPAGEYFEAWAQFDCFTIFSIAWNTYLFELMQNVDPISGDALHPHRLVKADAQRYDLGFPDSLADVVIGQGTALDVPIVFYDSREDG